MSNVIAVLVSLLIAIGWLFLLMPPWCWRYRQSTSEIRYSHFAMPAPGRRAGRRKSKTPAPPAAARPDSAAVLPMDIRVGDRFTEQGFEWEVVSRPEVLHGAKNIRARIPRPGLPESEREITWPAHVRIAVRRDATK